MALNKIFGLVILQTLAGDHFTGHPNANYKKEIVTPYVWWSSVIVKAPQIGSDCLLTAE